jgi:hypothetical protein
VQFPHQNRPSSSVLAACVVGVRYHRSQLEVAEDSAIPLIFNSLDREFNASTLYNTAPVRFRGKPFATVNIICKRLHTYPQKCP